MPKILPGHDDLKPRDVIGIDNNGRLLVDYGENGVRRFALKLNAGGTLSASPIGDESNGSDLPDQVGPRPTSPTLAVRLKDIDQG